MKKIIAAAMISSIAVASGEYRVTGKACNSESCIEYDEVLEDSLFDFYASKNKKTFIRYVADATGNSTSIIASTLDSIRGRVVNAGYEKFEGKLSGPAGTVDFQYNFRSGAWAISSSGGGSVDKIYDRMGGKKPF